MIVGGTHWKRVVKIMIVRKTTRMRRNVRWVVLQRGEVRAVRRLLDSVMEIAVSVTVIRKIIWPRPANWIPLYISCFGTLLRLGDETYSVEVIKFAVCNIVNRFAGASVDGHGDHQTIP